MGSQKKCLGQSERSKSFVTSYKIILKLLEFFTSYVESGKCLGHSKWSKSFVTSFKIILKLVEFFKSYGESEKIFRTVRKVQKLCNFIQNYSEVMGSQKKCLGHS